MLSANHKTPNKHTKIKKHKKHHPLKVVYISNPIKFNTSASQFRALVQELTGQDSDPPETAESSLSGGRGVVADGGVHAVEEVTEIVQSANGDPVAEKGSDPSDLGSYEDVLSAPEMTESLLSSNLCHEGSYLDVLRNLNAM